jgi:hypothetical protein
MVPILDRLRDFRFTIRGLLATNMVAAILTYVVTPFVRAGSTGGTLARFLFFAYACNLLWFVRELWRRQ